MGFHNNSQSHTKVLQNDKIVLSHLKQNKQNDSQNSTGKRTMFYIIKELYVLSVMQIICHQATALMAGIFNKHFYRHFYRSLSLMHQLKENLANNTIFFTVLYWLALFQRVHAFFSKIKAFSSHNLYSFQLASSAFQY